jgi:hypothetical protein
LKILLDECVDRRLAREVLRATSNRLAELKALVPEMLETLPATKPGQVTWIGT